MPKTLGPTDWGVLGAYFLTIALCGWWFSRRKIAGTQDYFLGGRSMPVWAVAISVIATSLSAATFVGVPQMSYLGDLTYLSTNIGSLIAVAVVAGFFIPVYYRENVTSIYELLDRRLGRGAMLGASVAFMLGRLLASGARLYIGAIPLALILFGDSGNVIPPWQLCAAIGVMAGVSIVYTLAGGIASVIWTEVVQTGVLLGAVIGAIVVLLHRIPLDTHGIVDVLSTAGANGASKLRVAGFGNGFSLADAYSLPSVVIAFALFGIAAYGTDHDLVQRTLTCRSAVKGGQSAFAAILMGIPVVTLFMVVGLLLFVFYRRPDVMGPAAPAYSPDDTRKVFLTFILREMPSGMSGLMIAGLFSVGISSTSSALNAMSATFVKDLYVHVAPGRDELAYVRVGRRAVVAWGLLLGVFGCFCVYWQQYQHASLIDFALGVMTFAYAGLLGVFMTAIFTRRGNSFSACAALVVGAVVILLMQDWVYQSWAKHVHFGGLALSSVSVAWPWHLFLAGAAATATCMLGRRHHAGATE